MVANLKLQLFCPYLSFSGKYKDRTNKGEAQEAYNQKTTSRL